MPPAELSATDHAIIEILQREGRTTYADIGSRVGVSATAAHERIKKLEARGVIRGYQAEIDPALVGAGVTAFIFVSQQAGPRSPVEELFADTPWVQECHHVAGEETLLLKVRAESMPALEHLVWDGAAAAAPVLIGADGVNGLTARSLELAGGRSYGVALEGNVSYVHAREGYRGRAVVELGAVPGGYAWVFPKGDHVNVGVGGWESEGPRLREHLDRACSEYGLPAERLQSLRGYRLPMRLAGARARRGRALLVGDAAGLVDPLSGDGIYEALVSARLAAESALELLGGGSLDGYEPKLDAALGRTLAASWKAKLALERAPRLVFGVARLPLVWGFTAAFLRGDLAHPGEAKGLVRAPLRLVEALGRQA